MAIIPKGTRMKSAIRMPIAMPLASGLPPGGIATSRVSHSSSFMVSSHWGVLDRQTINLWRFVSNVERDGLSIQPGRDLASLRCTNRQAALVVLSMYPSY